VPGRFEQLLYEQQVARLADTLDAFQGYKFSQY
jgi:hypothetical protein